MDLVTETTERYGDYIDFKKFSKLKHSKIIEIKATELFRVTMTTVSKLNLLKTQTISKLLNLERLLRRLQNLDHGMGRLRRLGTASR